MPDFDLPIQTDDAATAESPPVVSRPAEAGADDHDLQADATEGRDGERVVPLAVVQRERAKGREARARLAQTEQKLNEVSQRLAMVEPYLGTIVEFAKQQLTTQTPPQSPAKTRAEATRLSPIAEAVSQRLNVDVQTAQGLAEVVQMIAQEVAGQIVEQKVGPLARTVASAGAETMLAKALQIRDEQGRPFANPQAIHTVFDSIAKSNPDMAADPNVARLALLIARGLPGFEQPTYSATPGNRQTRADGLTGLDQLAAKMLGVSTETFRKNMGSGDSRVLEEY